MNLNARIWIRSLAVAAAGWLAWPAAAIQQDAVLGNDGELYTIKTGIYGSLFPEGQEADPGNSVLALEIARHGQPKQRLLVPDTWDKAVESSPAIFFETDSGAVFLVWESRLSSTQFSVRLASFDGRRWVPTIEITNSTKSSPQLAETLQLVATRDSHKEKDANGEPVIRHRTILHLTWSQENVGGLFNQAFYTPVIFMDGTFIGANPIYPLNGFDRSDDQPAEAVAAELVRSPMVQAGDDRDKVIVSFTSAVTGRLIALEVHVVPTQIRRLADKAHSSIIDLGAQHKPSRPTLAAKARDTVLNCSGEFQPEVARSLAELLYAHLLGDGSSTDPVEDLKAIAEDARGYLIDLGAKFASGRVLKSSPARLLQILETPTDPADDNPPAHLLQVRTASSRPAPAIGGGTVRVFVSDRGTSLLVSWAGKDRVYYRDSQPGGWSDVRELKLNDGMDLNKAYEVLNQRVQSR
jgi:hypothetical protein